MAHASAHIVAAAIAGQRLFPVAAAVPWAPKLVIARLARPDSTRHLRRQLSASVQPTQFAGRDRRLKVRWSTVPPTGLLFWYERQFPHRTSRPGAAVDRAVRRCCGCGSAGLAPTAALLFRQRLAHPAASAAEHRPAARTAAHDRWSRVARPALAPVAPLPERHLHR